MGKTKVIDVSALSEREKQFVNKSGNKVLYSAYWHQVATWVPIEDYDLLVALAKKHNLKLGVYLRAIITDAVAEERMMAVQTTQNQQPNQ